MPRTSKLKRKAPKKFIKPRFRKCLFEDQKIEYIDYKDIEILKKYISSNSGKILSRKVTGTSMKYQRKLSNAIKLAREAGFLPFVQN